MLLGIQAQKFSLSVTIAISFARKSKQQTDGAYLRLSQFSISLISISISTTTVAPPFRLAASVLWC